MSQQTETKPQEMKWGTRFNGNINMGAVVAGEHSRGSGTPVPIQSGYQRESCVIDIGVQALRPQLDYPGLRCHRMHWGLGADSVC